MLKETEETIEFLSLVAFQLGGGLGPPPGYAYERTIGYFVEFELELELETIIFLNSNLNLTKTDPVH